MNTPIVSIALLYLVLVTWFIIGWYRIPYFRKKREGQKSKNETPFFTVIIPARNEAERIQACLEGILRQDLTRENFEVFVVNDHSDDETCEVVKAFQQRYAGFQLHLLQSPETHEIQFVAYKKQAIQHGIKYANGDWIVTTDADCVPSSEWLSTLSAYIRENRPVMVSGPVQFSPVNTAFSAMQALEFMGLIAIGAASLKNNAPNMCNGANLAYRKAVFHEVNGFSGYYHLASGDDEFLLYKVFQKYPQHVKFLKNREAVVTTSPLYSLHDFLQQRKRWVSKGRAYKQWSTILVIYFVGLYHLGIIGSLVGWLAGVSPGIWPLILIGFKMGIEFLFLLPVSKFFQQRRLMSFYFPAGLLYPFYVVSIAIYANLGGYTWKSRKVR